MSNDEKIGENLNIEVDNGFHAPSKVLHQQRLQKTDDPVDCDSKYARENLYDLIETGRHAIDHMAEVAHQSQHPRAYEVLSTMIKQMVEANKDLMELHEKKKKLQVESEKQSPTVNNNHLYVGTTKDLQKLLRGENDE